jgi:hypothetical protein
MGGGARSGGWWRGEGSEEAGLPPGGSKVAEGGGGLHGSGPQGEERARMGVGGWEGGWVGGEGIGALAYTTRSLEASLSSRFTLAPVSMYSATSSSTTALRTWQAL